jgi:hypothetical protein
MCMPCLPRPLTTRSEQRLQRALLGLCDRCLLLFRNRTRGTGGSRD